VHIAEIVQRKGRCALCAVQAKHLDGRVIVTCRKHAADQEGLGDI
jgi:hypothetical protein